MLGKEKRKRRGEMWAGAGKLPNVHYWLIKSSLDASTHTVCLAEANLFEDHFASCCGILCLESPPMKFNVMILEGRKVFAFSGILLARMAMPIICYLILRVMSMLPLAHPVALWSQWIPFIDLAGQQMRPWMKGPIFYWILLASIGFKAGWVRTAHSLFMKFYLKEK